MSGTVERPDSGPVGRPGWSPARPGSVVQVAPGEWWGITYTAGGEPVELHILETPTRERAQAILDAYQ